MAGAETNPTIQALDEQFSAELAELANDIWLNDALFSAGEASVGSSAIRSLEAESRRLLEVTWQRFTLAGAMLEDEQKRRFAR